jgi:hypothetical protein
LRPAHHRAHAPQDTRIPACALRGWGCDHAGDRSTARWGGQTPTRFRPRARRCFLQCGMVRCSQRVPTYHLPSVRWLWWRVGAVHPPAEGRPGGWMSSRCPPPRGCAAGWPAPGGVGRSGWVMWQRLATPARWQPPAFLPTASAMGAAGPAVVGNGALATWRRLVTPAHRLPFGAPPSGHLTGADAPGGIDSSPPAPWVMWRRLVTSAQCHSPPFPPSGCVAGAAAPGGGASSGWATGWCLAWRTSGLTLGTRVAVAGPLGGHGRAVTP